MGVKPNPVLLGPYLPLICLSIVSGRISVSKPSRRADGRIPVDCGLSRLLPMIHSTRSASVILKTREPHHGSSRTHRGAARDSFSQIDSNFSVEPVRQRSYWSLPRALLTFLVIVMSSESTSDEAYFSSGVTGREPAGNNIFEYCLHVLKKTKALRRTRCLFLTLCTAFIILESWRHAFRFVRRISSS